MVSNAFRLLAPLLGEVGGEMSSSVGSHKVIMDGMFDLSVSIVLLFTYVKQFLFGELLPDLPSWFAFSFGKNIKAASSVLRDLVFS